MSGRVRVHRWKAKNGNLAEMRSKFMGLPCCAIDPGEQGFAFWDNKGSGLFGGAGNMEVARCLDILGISILVIESQFSKNNPKTALDISFGAGILIGQIHAKQECDVDVIQVAPATWQAHQRQHEGVQLKRGAGIELALKVAGKALDEKPFYRALAPSYKEGAASAFGIHQWWAHVMGQ